MTITDIAPAADAPQLRVILGGATIDLTAAERAVADLLVAPGRNPDDEHNLDTPRRVAAAYAELLTPRSFNPGWSSKPSTCVCRSTRLPGEPHV